MKLLPKNKRIIIGTVLSIILLGIVIARVAYFGYKQWRLHQIRIAKADQAIEEFLDIVNKPSGEFPNPQQPLPAPPPPNDVNILEAFDKIDSLQK